MRRRTASSLASVVIAALTAAPALGAASEPAATGSGIGSAEASIVGVRVSVPGAGEVRVVDSVSRATLDPERRGLDEQQATATFNAAVIDAGTYEQVAYPGWSSEVSESDRQSDHSNSFGEAGFQVPETPMSVVQDWDEFKQNTNQLVRDWVGEDTSLDQSASDVVDGSDEVFMAAGALLDGLVKPARLSTRLDGDSARADAASIAEFVKAFSGLSTVIEAGPGEQFSEVGDDHARAETTEMRIREVNVELGAVLGLLDIDIDALPPPVLAAMADAMNLANVEGVSANAQAFLDKQIDTFGDVSRYEEAIGELIDAVLDASGLGVGCDILDEHIKDKRGLDMDRRADELGIDRLDCLGTLNAVDDFVDDLEALRDDLVDLLGDELEPAPLVSFVDVWSSLRTVAAVDPSGDPQASVTAEGGVSRVSVGGLNGADRGFSVDDEFSALNAYEATTNNLIDSVMSLLGPEFQDVVRVRFVPKVIEAPEVTDGNYASARGEYSLVKVTIDPPDLEALGLPGSVGQLGDGLHARAATEPTEIEIGGMLGEAEHTRPGSSCCGGGDDDDDDSSTLLNRPWDPERGFGTPNEGEMPRTGGAAGTWPIAVAGGLAVLSLGLTRVSRDAALPWPRERSAR